MSTRSTRGYSLVIVMMTLGLITVAMLSLWASLEGAAKATGEIVKKRNTFYTCDGMSRVVGKLVGDYVKQETGALTKTAAEDYVDAAAPNRLRNMLPAGYKIDRFEISAIRAGGFLPVANGPFEGIVGRETELKFLLRLREQYSDVACQVEKTLALSDLGLFQFGLFIAVDPFQLSHRIEPGGSDSAYYVTGHVHANGDLCSGDKTDSSERTWIEKLTVAGDFYKDATPCAQSDMVVNEALTVHAVPHLPANAQVTSDSRDASWVADCVSSGRMRDSALGVAALETTGSSQKQPTLRADGTAGTQSGSLRFLVDPPLATESVAEKSSKLAYQADIRIIDGVWYKRDAANPDAWPGTPIWSDHPGNAREYTAGGFASRSALATPGTQVGQSQLATALAWGGTVPRRYSYYAWDTATSTYFAGTGADLPVTAAAPVISYGGLARDSRVGAVRWIPAVLARSSDPALAAATYDYCTPCVSAAVCSSEHELPAITANDAFCATRNRSAHLARAAASTMSDTHLAATRQRVLTTNFDVEAFQGALNDTGTGELGSHFSSTPFNGIIWISSLWPGGWDGFASGTPISPDAPGASVLNAVPYPLCSESVTATLDTGVPAMAIPSCTGQLAIAGAVRPWPNAVRVMNARNVNSGASLGAATGQLPNGLTIASNLPVYIQGDVNASSSPAATSTDADTAATWVPVLVAGDTVTLLSNSFQDVNLFRQQSDPTDAYPKDASATTYNLSILTSAPYTQTSSRSVDLKATMHLLERWQTMASVAVKGAVVVGYNPVYAGFWDGGDVSTNGARRTERTMPTSFSILFDYRLLKVKEPPGNISFNVQAVRRWERY